MAHPNTRHGWYYSRLYRIWRGIIDRCYNENIEAYPRYGGRGITVCSEWRNDVAAFAEWSMANGYGEGLIIDRIDNDRGYCPENCRWVTYAESSRNRRNIIMLTAFGETKPLHEWLQDHRCQAGRKIVWDRLRKLGWDAETAITTPTLTNSNRWEVLRN